MRPDLHYRTPLIVALAVLLFFSVLSLGLKQSPVLKEVQGSVVTITAPVLKALESLGRRGRDLWLGYFYLVGARQENLQLHRSLEEYRQKEIQFQEAQQALTRLEALLTLKRQVALPVIGARVIAYDLSLWSRCALIDQGKAQGVKTGLPVLAPEGIVGRVVEAYPQYPQGEAPSWTARAAPTPWCSALGCEASFKAREATAAPSISSPRAPTSRWGPGPGLRPDRHLS